MPTKNTKSDKVEKQLEEVIYKPKENEIILIKDPDGNWRAKGWRFNKFVQSREAKPEDALYRVLFHE